MKKIWSRHPLVLLVFIFILTRLLFLNLDISFPGFGQELHQGMIAYEMIHGIHLPLQEYRLDHHTGGAEAIIGLLTVPFFLIFGPNLFALRLGGGVVWPPFQFLPSIGL